MSTPALSTPARDLDVSGTPRTPFLRLVSVELRKSWDTRAGRWLLGTIALITAAAMVIFYVNVDADEKTFINFLGISATPQGLLLPVLGILLVTSEWSQRTAMVTFALEPSRGRVVSAKTVAALVLGLLAMAVAVGIAVLCTVLGGTEDGFGSFGASDMFPFVLLQMVTVLQGLAYGMLLLNTPAAIVVFFVLPIAFNIVANLVSWFQEKAPWIDLATAQQPLFSGDTSLTGEQWAQLGTTTLIWILIPFVLGWVRIMRAELK